MTEFKRNGYYRYRNGNLEWVSSHWVERDGWDRNSYSSTTTIAHQQLITLRAASSLTSQYINPNAKCPVCGQDVFFYQNVYGSRVFFDELGPPWPKHPCTDNPSQRKSVIRKKKNELPLRRDHDQFIFITSLAKSANLRLKEQFNSKYGTKNWDCWKIEKRLPGHGKTILILSSCGQIDLRKMYIVANRIPKILNHDVLVYYRRGRLAFYNNATMKPGELSVQRLAGATSLVNALIQKTE